MDDFLCASCVHGPPSSLDGKPCCNCEPSDPLMNAYHPKEAKDGA